ncbi:MAG: hypothetical protein PHX00_09495 [Synergistaceae bacterium]|nr:hypothetical protein [Synergistaceae bacterium]
MRLTRVSVPVLTNSEGAAVAYTPALNGMVRSVRYVKPDSGGLDNDSDIDIVTDKGAVVVWDKDDLDTSAVIYPMVPAHDNTGTLVEGSYAPIPVCDERIKITVANGGNALAGTFEFLIEGVAL